MHLDVAAFPPEPWHLGGSLLVSTFHVEPAHIPDLAAALPDGHRPALVGGRAVVSLASVTYTPGSVLAYDELLVAVLTCTRGALRATITQIWVTSAASAAGGRALWGIPKHLATVTRHDGTQVRLPDGAPIVRLDARPGRRLVPALTFPLPTAQRPLPDTTPDTDGTPAGTPASAAPTGTGNGSATGTSADSGTGAGSIPARSVITSHNRITGDVRLLHARWDVAPSGPLGWLAGRRPLLSVAVTDAAITFGRRVTRP